MFHLFASVWLFTMAFLALVGVSIFGVVQRIRRLIFGSLQLLASLDASELGGSSRR